jgi:cobalt/nickel transport system permease protein
VAIDMGFIDAGLDASYELLPDYTIPFLGESESSTILAGLIGAVIVGLIAFGLVKLLRRKSIKVES